MSEEGFFSRWARRKSEVRSGRTSEEQAAKSAPAPDPRSLPPSSSSGAPRAVPPAGAAPQAASPDSMGASGPAAVAPAAPAEPLPSMADVAQLRHDSDYSGFMRQGVDENVKRAAMKKLFTDPHYNVMDRLDIYIDDYSKPDPIPASMLRKMVQSQMLGLFKDEEAEKEKAAAVADATPVAVPPHDSGEAAVSQSRAEEAPASAPAAPAVAVANPESEQDGAAGFALPAADGGSVSPESQLPDPGAADRPAGRS